MRFPKDDVVETEYESLSALTPPGPWLRFLRRGWGWVTLAVILLAVALVLAATLPDRQLDRLERALTPDSITEP